MEFRYLWPFFLLLLIPIIILLYLLRQKTQDKTISSLYLWKEAYKNMEASRPWEKFRNNVLMYLQIAVVLLVILSLAAPYLKTGGIRHGQVIMVLDTSASMNMDYDDRNTRLEQAITEAENYIDNLSQGTAVTILAADLNTTILGANITDKLEMKRILSEIKGTDLPGDMQKAAAYAASIASQWEDYEAVFFTDVAVEAEDLNKRVIYVNSEMANACIDYVSLSQTEEEMVVLAKITNTSTAAFSSDINFYIDDTLMDIKNIALEAEESTILYFEGLKPQGEVIWVEINEKDALVSDNVSYTIREANDELTALLVTKQNIFLETAATSFDQVAFYKTTQPGSFGEESFDLYIFDAVLPEELPPKGGMIFINPPESVAGILEKGEELANIYIKTVAHEVTRYIEDTSFGVLKADALLPSQDQESFLKVGESTVGLVGEYQGRTIAVLGFDFHNTDFPMQMEFPILIHNLISYCLNQGLVRQPVIQAGDAVAIYPDTEGADIVIIYPDGEEERITVDGRASYQITLPYSGLYTITQETSDEILSQKITVRFPTALESYSDTLLEAAPEGVTVTEGLEGSLEVGSLFLILALLLLCVEWLVYVRSR